MYDDDNVFVSIRESAMRKIGLLLVPLLLIAFVVFAPANARDDTDVRLSALETRIAVIETQIAGPATAPTKAAATSDAITVSGVGVSTSEDFTLQAGRYQVTATWSGGDYFIGHLWEPSGEGAYLFNEYQASQTATVVYMARESGTYFMEVSNTDGPWEITFSPR